MSRLYRATGAALVLYGLGVASSPMVAAVAVVFGLTIFYAGDLV